METNDFLQECNMCKRKVEEVDLVRNDQLEFVPSMGGGPILGIPTAAHAMMKEIGVPTIRLFKGNGEHLKDFKVDKIDSGDRIEYVGWSRNYKIQIVTVNKKYYLYNLDGECFVNHVIDNSSATIKTCYFFEFGCCVHLDNFQMVSINLCLHATKDSSAVMPLQTHSMRVEADCVCMTYLPSEDDVLCFAFGSKAVRLYYLLNPSTTPQTIKFYDQSKVYSEIVSTVSAFISSGALTLVAIQKEKSLVKKFKLNVYSFSRREWKFNKYQTGSYTIAENEIYGKGICHFLSQDSYCYEKAPNVFEFAGMSKLAINKICYRSYDRVYSIHNDLNTLRVIARKNNIFTVDVLTVQKEALNRILNPPLELTAKEDKSLYNGRILLDFYHKQSKISNLLELMNEERKETPQETITVYYIDEGIKSLCSSALFLSPNDPRQKEFLSCASYFLPFVRSIERLSLLQEIYRSASHICRLLNTFVDHGILMTYPQFNILSYVERGRAKSDRHGKVHTNLALAHDDVDCTAVDYHAIQAMLIAIDEFALCIRWCAEAQLSTFPVQEQWSKVSDANDRDITDKNYRALSDVKRRLQLLSAEHVTRVLHEATTDPRIEILLYLSDINSACRFYVVTKLLQNDTGAQQIIAAIFLKAVFTCDQRTVFYFFKKALENSACVILERKEELASVHGLINRHYEDITVAGDTLDELIPVYFREGVNNYSSTAGMRLLWRFVTSWEIFVAANPKKDLFGHINILSLENTFFGNFTDQGIPQKVPIDGTDGEWYYWYKFDKGSDNLASITRSTVAVNVKRTAEEKDIKEKKERELTRSVFEILCELFNEEEVNEETIQEVKRETNCSDKLVLRAELQVITDMSNGNPEKTRRLSKFLNVKRPLFPWAHFVKIAHDGNLTALRDEFLSKIDSIENRVKTLIEINDFEAALELSRKSMPLLQTLSKYDLRRNSSITDAINKAIDDLQANH
ncbi:Uncharacterized protein QTN25_003817 [Entamoeba marina]